MGMPASKAVLGMSGLRARERFYSSLPCPPLPTEGVSDLPAGHARVPVSDLGRSLLRRCRAWEREVFYPSVTSLSRVNCPVRSPARGSYWDEVRRDTVSWSRPKPWLVRATTQLCRRLRSTWEPIPEATASRVQRVWVPVCRLSRGRLGVGHRGYVLDFGPGAWGSPAP